MPAIFQMKISIDIKYYNAKLNIGLEDVRNAWYLPKDLLPVKLITIMHQGLLTYRFPPSGKRISYRTLKQGLEKKNLTILLPVQLLPF